MPDVIVAGCPDSVMNRLSKAANQVDESGSVPDLQADDAVLFHGL